MATTQIALGFPSGANLFRETALGASAITVKSSAGTIHAIKFDNSANSTQAVFLKLFHTNGAVTIGTTVPEQVIHGSTGEDRTLIIPTGKSFASGLQLACLTGAGATSTGAPGSAVDVQVVYT